MEAADIGRRLAQRLPEFMPISARFIANRASYQFKHRQIETLLKKLTEVTES